jgi:hypothetical protein
VSVLAWVYDVALIPLALLAVCLVFWWIYTWAISPRPMALDLRGRSPALRIRPLTYREREYLTACNQDGYRFAIVPEEDDA